MNKNGKNSEFSMPEGTKQLLLDAKMASKLCGVGLSLWYELSAKGRVPQPVSLNSKKLWVYEHLQIWSRNSCPRRDSPEWQQILEKLRELPA